MPNRMTRWIRTGVQACMSCILPPKPDFHPPEKKKRKKRRFWMIRRNNKVGVDVSNVATPRKKETKSTSDEKSSPKRPLPPAKKRPNPNCKECINKVHSPRKLKARLSAKIEAIRHEDALAVADVSDVSDVAEASQKVEEIVSCRDMLGNGDLEGDKLDVVDLEYDDDKDIVCGGKANYRERDQRIDVGEEERNGFDGVKDGDDDDDEDDIAFVNTDIGEISDASHDDDDDVVCGRNTKGQQERNADDENGVEDDDDGGDNDIVYGGDRHIDVGEKNGNAVDEVDDDGDDDDDDIVSVSTDELSDASHDDNDDIVCGRDSKSVEKKSIGQNDTREDEVVKSMEQGVHDDDDDIVCGIPAPCTDSPKYEVMRSMDEHDDDDDIVCVTPAPCTDYPKYESATQSQANEGDISSFTEVSDVDSSDDELDWDSCSTTVSDNENTSSDTISEYSDIVAHLAGEYSGLEMSNKPHEQDGGLKDDTIGDGHYDDDDVICDDQADGSKVQTMDIKQEHVWNGGPEGDIECHGEEVTGDGKEDSKDETSRGHSTEDKDQAPNAREFRSSVVDGQEIHGQRSVSLDKCSALTGTDSSEKTSYAELILNLASVIGDMKASGSSYESRARLIGQMMSGKKTVDISETKENGQIATKEVGSHNMAGDMKIQSSDEATDLPKSPLETCQTKPNQKTMDDPLVDIDQLLDEASKLF